MWIDLLDNKKTITSIFGEDKPSLEDFTVKGVELDLLKNSLKLVGDLSSYPESPPKKWSIGKFNTVHIVLELWNLRELNLGDYKKLALVNLVVSKDGADIVCKASGGFSCKAELVDLLEISAYQNS